MRTDRLKAAASLIAVAVLTGAVVTGPAGGVRAAAAAAVAMPRFVAADGNEIVVVDSSGHTTVYAADGEQVWTSETDGASERMDWPAKGQVTSEFGWRGGRMHNGIDIAAATGTAITAAGGGQVAFAGWKGGYGNTVIIDHGDGTRTLYAHQSTTDVAEDDHVSRGDKIGEVGTTGSSTGPHLHFEVRDGGDPHDPRDNLVRRA